jgi:hypothetical protein
MTTHCEQQIELLIKWQHPDNVDAHFLILPREAVEATCVPLLPQSAGTTDVWWQLSEDDRRSFRVVYFHTKMNALERGDLKTPPAVVSWLRWLAVRQAKSERQTWPDAYDDASDRLKGTIAQAAARTMKAEYAKVQCILRAPPIPM